MRRRDFIARAMCVAARAQQPALPVVGFLRVGSADASARYVAAFRKGLYETGYVESQNVTVEYHWLEGQLNRLPALLADLVRRQVAVIAAPGNVPALAAKAATSTIPIVFGVAQDPVKLGLVASSPGLGATRQALIILSKRWWPSGCGSCMTWCPRAFVSLCSSIRPMLQAP